MNWFLISKTFNVWTESIEYELTRFFIIFPSHWGRYKTKEACKEAIKEFRKN